MFKVIDKRNNNIREIYDVRNNGSSPQFLYYDSKTKDWEWCFASYCEPYFENRFIVEDKPHQLNSDIIGGIITVTDRITGHYKNKEWKTYEDGFTDREYVIEMLKSALLKEN